MKTYSLSIPKPCSEKWQNFVPTDTGGFCGSCNKVVIDFTRMTDDQVVDFLKQKPVHACGRFRPEQLKQYHQFGFATVRPGYSLLKAGALSLLFLLTTRPSSANSIPPGSIQTVQVTTNIKEVEFQPTASGFIVRGVVRDEDKSPIPAVSIVIKGTNIGTFTDEYGRFELPQKVEAGDAIILSFIGYETMEYVIRSSDDKVIELTLLADVSILGELAIDGMYTQNSGFKTFWSKVKSLF